MKEEYSSSFRGSIGYRTIPTARVISTHGFFIKVCER